jgi:ubiquitin C-terminal hydrolase
LIVEKVLIVLRQLLPIAKEQMLATPETDTLPSRLTAISAKTGAAQSRHYTSVVFHEQWRKFNDEEVAVVNSPEEIFSLEFGRQEKTSAYL